MSTKGYQTYRGRMPLWKKVLIGALILILLAAGGGMLMNRYVVFDETGAHIQLPLQPERPAPGNSENSGEEGENGDVDIIIDIQEPEAPQKTLQELHGKAISVASLERDGLSGLQEDVRAVLVLKSTHQAALYQTDAERAALQETLQGHDAVVRISCFADDATAAEDPSMAILESDGTLWKDSFGRSWLNPYEEATAEYIAEIAQGYAQMGATEIVLDDILFPVSGAVERMDFGTVEDTADNRIAAVAHFVETVTERMEPYGVAVSAAVPASLLQAKTIRAAGLDLQEIAQAADRIYADAENQAQADANRAAVAACVPEKDAAIAYVAQTYAPITGGSYVLN